MFTVDTRLTDCHIRIMYTEVMTGNNLHSHDLDGRIWRAPVRPLAVIILTEHGDYAGDSVHKSNYRVLWERFPDHLVQIYGSHGYQALAYDATLGPVPGNEELCEALEGLQDCPLIDEEDEGELEMELESEAWEDHGRSAFRKALVSVFDEMDRGHEHDIPDDDAPYGLSVAIERHESPRAWKDALQALWSWGCDELNVNGGSGFVVETGCSVHFYIDDWKAKAGCVKRYPTSKHIHAALRALATLLRSE